MAELLRAGSRPDQGLSPPPAAHLGSGTFPLLSASPTRTPRGIQGLGGRLPLAPLPTALRSSAAAGAASRGPFCGEVGARRRQWAAGFGSCPSLAGCLTLGRLLQKGDAKGTYFPGL